MEGWERDVPGTGWQKPHNLQCSVSHRGDEGPAVARPTFDEPDQAVYWEPVQVIGAKPQTSSYKRSDFTGDTVQIALCSHTHNAWFCSGIQGPCSLGKVTSRLQRQFQISEKQVLKRKLTGETRGPPPSSPKSATRKQLHEGRQCVSSLPKPSAWQCSIDEWCPGSSQKRRTHRKQAKLLRVTRVVISGQTSYKMKKDRRADLPLGGQTSWWQREGFSK